MVENQGENDDDVADAWDYGEEGGESEDEKVDDPTCEWLNDEIPPDDPESSPTVESKQDPMESSKISDSVNNVPRADADTEPKDLTTMVLAIQLLSTNFLEGRLSNLKSQSMQLSHKTKKHPIPSLHRMMQRRLRALRLWPLELPWKEGIRVWFLIYIILPHQKTWIHLNTWTRIQKRFWGD